MRPAWVTQEDFQKQTTTKPQPVLKGSGSMDLETMVYLPVIKRNESTLKTDQSLGHIV